MSLANIGLSVERGELIAKEGKYSLEKRVVKLLKSVPIYGAVLLPVLLERADVPPLLRQIQWLDMTDGNVGRAVNQLVDLIHHYGHPPPTPISPKDKPSERGMKVPKSKIIAILEEEKGIVGASAKRLGLTPKRLYQLLKHYNIQARQFR